MSSKVKNWLLFFATCLVVVLLAMLGSNIAERRSESQFAYQPKVKVTKFEPRNELWGKNYPRQYQSFLKTDEETFKTMNNGNILTDALEESPELVVLWAGYGFSKDYNQPRGHQHAVEDIRNTLRTGGPSETKNSPMPSTCWTCKSPDVPRLMNEIGIAEFYAGNWKDKGAQIVNNIGCADCHNNETMELQISRPALIEAFQSMGKDIDKASHQEMRSLVCAQCHVEYYFNKHDPQEGVPYLTFPWKNGLTVEDAEKYYDDMNFSDWTHKLSKTPMLKAQHPGYETTMQGIHAKRGVSCADCHMPYKTEGGQKFTDHHIQSPLANPANSCQVCHREEEKELVENVYSNQRKIKEGAKRLEKLLVRAHVEAKKAWDLGATEAQMKPIQMDIRHAQWRWDYAVASHGGSFHAPVEIGRIITTGTDKAQEARVKLARLLAELGYDKEVPYPDIETKAKAQQYVGLDMEKLEAEKKSFKENLLPKWIKEAQAREAKYGVEEVETVSVK